MSRLAVIIVAVALASCDVSAQRVFDTDILRDTFGYDASTRRSIDLDALQQGCPARDCIPSIDAPEFIAAKVAHFLDDDDLVVAVSIDGDHRAYPTRILDRHEIVNDTIAGEPIAITWCPLCGSAVGIRREIDGKITEFGVSGLLYNSDLVFYDRTTETLWDQIEATGIVGPLTGIRLRFVPVTVTRWERWRDAHPDTRVLSAETGFSIDYSLDPYAEYRTSNRLFMPVSHEDDRLHPKTVVYGFDLEDGPIAVTEALLEESDVYEIERNGDTWTIHRQQDGVVTLKKGQDAAKFAPIRLFWFAWYTFHPQTELIQ